MDTNHWLVTSLVTRLVVLQCSSTCDCTTGDCLTCDCSTCDCSRCMGTRACVCALDDWRARCGRYKGVWKWVTGARRHHHRAHPSQRVEMASEAAGRCRGWTLLWTPRVSAESCDPMDIASMQQPQQQSSPLPAMQSRVAPAPAPGRQLSTHHALPVGAYQHQPQISHSAR